MTGIRNKTLSVFLVLLLTASVLLVTPQVGAQEAEEEVILSSAQINALQRFGEGAPFGVPGKMIEDATLYLRSDPFSSDVAPDPAANHALLTVESFTGPYGADNTPAPGEPQQYEQVENAVATFERPDAMISRLQTYTPADPVLSAYVQAKPATDPVDLNDKRVRLGVIDAEGYGANAEEEEGLGLGDPDYRFTGTDFQEQVSFLTPPDLAAEADFRIYEVQTDLWAQCTIPSNVVGQGDSWIGDLAVAVFRTDLEGNRIRNEAGHMLPITVFSAGLSSDSSSFVIGEAFEYLEDGGDRTSALTGGVNRYTGSTSARASYFPQGTEWLRAQADGNPTIGPSHDLPSFQAGNGLLVKQGERLEFEIGLWGAYYGRPIDTADGRGFLGYSELVWNRYVFVPEASDPDPNVSPEFWATSDIECHLHYDTLRDEDATSPGPVDPAAPEAPSYKPDPSGGYESKILIKGDTKRVATWVTATTEQPAVGLGDGDSFHLDTIYASAWGSAAKYLEDQPHLMHQRTTSRFLERDTLKEVEFDHTGSQAPVALMDSLTWTRDSYGFATGTKELEAHRAQILLHDESFDDNDPTDEDTYDNDDPPLLHGISLQDAVITTSPDVFIGKTGMNFFLDPTETATHLVNPGEPTVFSYIVENLGANPDTITISADTVGGGWTAEILNSYQYVGGGGSGVVTVKVTPPLGAQDGDVSPPIRVSALSSFADIIPRKTAESVFVEVTSEVVSGLDVGSATESIALVPGGFRTVGLTARNLGTAEDHYVASVDLPDDVQGWSVKVNPPGRSILAGAQGEFQLEVTAPIEAPAELEFPITVTVKRVGDDTVFDTVDLLVQVVGRYALGVDILPADYQLGLREKGPIQQVGPARFTVSPRDLSQGATDDVPAVGEDQDECVGLPAALGPEDNPAPDSMECHDIDNDPAFSDTIVFPILLENKGSLDDTYKVLRVHNSLSCSSSSWSYRMAEFGQLYDNVTFTSSKDTPFTFDVPAGGSKYIAFELDPCGAPNVPADISVTFASANDPVLLRGPFTFRVDPEAEGEYLSVGQYAGARHEVAIRPNVTSDETLFVQRGDPVTHQFRVANQGNERDTLVIRANQPPTNSGWTQTLSVNTVLRGNITESGCSVESALTIRCVDMRVGEEVLLDLTVTPSNFVPFGDLYKSVVSVASGDDGSKTDVLERFTKATGEFAFSALTKQPTMDAEIGRTTFLPFTIQNIGTNGDDYSVFLSDGDPAFRPRISVLDATFVPAAHSLHGFVAVTPPADATLGEAEKFTLTVQSVGNGAAATVDLNAVPVAASELVLEGVPGPQVPIPIRGEPTPVTVRATDLTAQAGKNVTFTLDTSAVPAGWTFSAIGNETTLAADAGGDVIAEWTFQVTAPTDALGTSRLPLRVLSETVDHTPTLSAFTDLVFELSSESGLAITAPLGDNATVVRGASYTYPLVVENLGLGSEAVVMTTAGLEAGWSVQMNPASFSLGPLETLTVDVTVDSPLDASPGSSRTIGVFANAAGGAVGRMDLTTTIGFFDMDITSRDDRIDVAPGVVGTQVINVTNTGTVVSDIDLDVSLDATTYADFLSIELETDLLEDVRPGESRDVLVRWEAADGIPPKIAATGTVSAAFIAPEAEGSMTYKVTADILDYRARDADLDGILEYAVDVDDDADNGLEAFFEGSSDNGALSSSLDMAAYLSDEAAEGYAVDVPDEDGNLTRVIRFTVDGDDDGRVDHFLDSNGNLLPDFYWDPDSGVISPLTVFKDVTSDDIPDYFMDLDGDGLFDAVYDLTTGEFIPVRIRDVDGDGVEDYLVDKDGDGEVDDDEAFLYTKDGQLLTVQKVDMDGDGRPDSVLDLDGDGKPDAFIPADGTASVPILLKDVNGDGVSDWTYDADGDARVDSYYDPVTGETSLIDTKANFVDALEEYWYVSALFAAVLVLFVVLLFVTRR